MHKSPDLFRGLMRFCADFKSSRNKSENRRRVKSKLYPRCAQNKHQCFQGLKVFIKRRIHGSVLPPIFKLFSCSLDRQNALVCWDEGRCRAEACGITPQANRAPVRELDVAYHEGRLLRKKRPYRINTAVWLTPHETYFACFYWYFQ